MPPIPLSFIRRVFLVTLAALSGCSEKDDSAAQHSYSPEITVEDLADRTAILASDAFGGRPPSGPMADKTVAYLTEAFKRMGLNPAFEDHYVQNVPWYPSPRDQMPFCRSPAQSWSAAMTMAPK